ncbi:hypothetical protein PPACK8108_LOCUS635 [Phakopsora pachyrhizi]|uniref:Uncharacterized protein n=1 Tax=Phakopsora pachyrhizi TaxID=170000 RepID=A0AAV0AGX1_PHAPC|nr:hypothetical protein PPACK8108_LOCUS635 [Phakopsora pachyrhizi]
MTTPGGEEVRRPTNKNKKWLLGGVICGRKSILESVSEGLVVWIEEAQTDRLGYDLRRWEPEEYEYLKRWWMQVNKKTGEVNMDENKEVVSVAKKLSTAFEKYRCGLHPSHFKVRDGKSFS